MNDSQTQPAERRTPIALMTAALLPIIWLLASLMPQGRVWGVNLWAFFPTGLAVTIALASIIALVAAWRFIRTSNDVTDARGPGRIFLFALPPVLGLLFWLLRNRAHFLGDGYQILSQLAVDRPLIKTSETGETLLHIAARNLFGNDATAVLHGYQLLSIAAGVLFAVSVVLFAVRLYRRGTDRLLFALTMLTGGYTMLYFGYVENYSIYVLAVLWFCLTGVIVARGNASRFWILLPLLTALFMHVIGVALIPAAIYLLLADTGATRMRRSIQWLLLAVVGIAGLLVFVRLYGSNLFFRYAFVPIVPIEITADGYTMFSWHHLLDYVNLRLLLIPASPILLLTLWRAGRSRNLRSRDRRFLLIAAVTATVVTFVLDPKLGMPRDWDLFSFAAVPALLLFLRLSLTDDRSASFGRRAVIFVIVLGTVALGSRVAVQISPDLAIKRLDTYIALDHARNRATFQVLHDYYVARRNQVAYDRVEARYRHDYPEAELGAKAEQLVQEGALGEAIATANRAIKLNPAYWAGYAGLGYALIQRQQYDSARTVLRIANGLNPNNPIILHNLGYTWLWAGDARKAESMWKRAYRLDTTQTQTLVYLARLYTQEKRPKDHLHTLQKLVDHPDAPLNAVVELADIYAAAGRYSDAAALYQRARKAGLDETVIQKQLEQYPQLKNYLTVVE